MSYRLTKSVSADLAAFKARFAEFQGGKIDADAFKTYRVPFGIYEQREKNTYMVRVKLSGGSIAPSQLAALATIADRYANAVLHVTTRGGLQLHYVKIDDLAAVLDALHKAGLTGRGGGGNTARNITADPLAGIAADEVFDVSPYADALTEKMFDQKDSYNLPRKFKITFSGSDADRGYAALADVGFIAVLRGADRGFKVFIGGGMGAKSAIGRLFADFIPANEAFLYAQAIKEVFNERGNRRNKHNARLRFLVEELGFEEFKTLAIEKIAEVRSRGGWEVDVDFSAKLPAIADRVGNLPNDLWFRRYVIAERQAGCFCAKVPLFLGDISAKSALKLAELLIKIAEDRDVLRFACDQNLYLRSLTAAELNVIAAAAKEISPLAEKPAIIGDSVVCAGAATCQLGITVPRGAIAAVEKALVKANVDLDALQGFKIRMSGCPNSCGRHLTADLGFFGKVARLGGVAYPAYNIVAGARIGGESTAFARKIGEIGAFRLPEFCAELLGYWVAIKADFAEFADWIDNGGEKFIADLAVKYAEIPAFEEDKNPYYDFGAKEVFSTANRGAGECSAGMYDLIEADKKALLAALSGEDYAQIRLLSARMLLVARGEEARDEAGVLVAFKRAFIDAGLVDRRFESLLSGAADARAKELARAVIDLYGSMDNTLRFNAAQTLFNATNRVEKTEEIKFKDYRGVACPMNFVKTKMDLSQMKSGEILEILLDDGAPIDNVPKSVKAEGHTIEKTDREGDFWRVRIRKK
ncbi:MAG: sulfurtransferase TusA family protein [Helicobacteraceae bacterium]|jgi:sulfite reductase (ferredoxin)|nr:sulfurtransferase TusA family protein [Helicobacteraceae bacterium]